MDSEKTLKRSVFWSGGKGKMHTKVQKNNQDSFTDWTPQLQLITPVNLLTHWYSENNKCLPLRATSWHVTSVWTVIVAHTQIYSSKTPGAAVNAAFLHIKFSALRVVEHFSHAATWLSKTWSSSEKESADQNSDYSLVLSGKSVKFFVWSFTVLIKSLGI